MLYQWHSLFYRYFLRKIPVVRVVHRAALVRPPLLNQRTIVQFPRHHQVPVARNNAPRHIPVLQPPVFLREPNYYEEEEEQQYQEEYYNYPTVAVMDQHRTITQQFPIRTSALIPQQNYPKQQTTRLSNRYTQPKYLYNR
jgi:hypothetical protein